MFPRPEIEERLSKFVLVRLWTNDPKPEARSARWKGMLETRFRTSSIPLYVALTGDDAELGRITYPGGTPEGFARDLAAWLDAMLAKAK